MTRRNLNKPERVARAKYDELGVDFDELVLEHLDIGFVISTPCVFALGYFYEEDGIVCHLTYVTGDMKSLFEQSINYSLDILEFERNFSGETKRYDFKKFTEKL